MYDSYESYRYNLKSLNTTQQFSKLQHYSSYNNFFSFEMSFGGHQSNASMTIVLFILQQFGGHVRSLLRLGIAYYDKVISHFVEMEGYYVEATIAIK